MYRESSPAVRRQQIVDVFLLRAPVAERAALRQLMEGTSIEELEIAYANVQAQDQLQKSYKELLEVRAEADVHRALHENNMFKTYEIHDREMFGQAARALGFGENDANFSLIKYAIGWNFTEDKIKQAIDSNAVSLAPATSQEKELWRQESWGLDETGRAELLAQIRSRTDQTEFRYAIHQFIHTENGFDLRERIALCEEIAKSHSPDPTVNNREFCLLLLNKRNDNETYRQQVATLRQNKEFAKMSPLELKSYLTKQRVAQQPSHEQQVAAEIVTPVEQTLLEAAKKDPRPPLPEKIRGEEVNAAWLNKLRTTDYSGYRALENYHGKINIDLRERGIR